MILSLSIVFSTFATLGVLTFLKPSGFKNRKKSEWLLDSVCLLTQGLLVPVVQVVLLERLWELLAPSQRGMLHLHPAVAFGMSFVLVDYLYYWNHRILHHPLLWRWHKLHHSTRNMDFLATSRNSLLTPALIIYVWINSIFSFLLGDASYFMIASAIGAALDLWRHSGFVLREGSLPHKLLTGWLILPQDHEWHHALNDRGMNFGANLNFWDRLHGTFSKSQERPQSLGLGDAETFGWKDFLWPFPWPFPWPFQNRSKE